MASKLTTTIISLIQKGTAGIRGEEYSLSPIVPKLVLPTQIPDEKANQLILGGGLLLDHARLLPNNHFVIGSLHSTP